MTALTAAARGEQVGFAADTLALRFTALLTRFHVNWKDEGENESRLHAESFFFHFPLRLPRNLRLGTAPGKRWGDLRLAEIPSVYWLKHHDSTKPS